MLRLCGVDLIGTWIYLVLWELGFRQPDKTRIPFWRRCRANQRPRDKNRVAVLISRTPPPHGSVGIASGSNTRFNLQSRSNSLGQEIPICIATTLVGGIGSTSVLHDPPLNQPPVTEQSRKQIEETSYVFFGGAMQNQLFIE